MGLIVGGRGGGLPELLGLEIAQVGRGTGVLVVGRHRVRVPVLVGAGKVLQNIHPDAGFIVLVLHDEGLVNLGKIQQAAEFCFCHNSLLVNVNIFVVFVFIYREKEAQEDEGCKGTQKCAQREA